jgi:hypothetical protein
MAKANQFCLYDSLSGVIVFHDSEEEANEDYQLVVELIKSLNAHDHEVLLFELKKKMRFI